MVDHDRQLRPASDLDRFADGFLHAEALAADVRDVDAAVLRRDARERDELLGIGVRRRRIDQRRRESKRALLHRALEDVLFALQFVRRRQAVLHPEHLLADVGDRRERS